MIKISNSLLLKSTIQLIQGLQDADESQFKKDFNLQIHLHKTFYWSNRFLDLLPKYFLNHTILDLRKEKWGFLNRNSPVLLNLID